MKRLIYLCLVVMFLVGFTVFTHPDAGAQTIRYPRELAGAWVGYRIDKKTNQIDKSAPAQTYNILVQQNRIIILKPGKSGAPRPFVGFFNRGGFDVRYAPFSADNLPKDLPEKIRQLLVQSNYTVHGRIDIASKPPSTLELKFTEHIDEITYNDKATEIQNIETRVDESVVILTRPAGYTIGKIELDNTAYKTRTRKEIERLEQLQYRLKREISGLEEKLASATTRLDDGRNKLAQLEKQRDTLKPEIQRLSKEIADATANWTEDFQALINQQARLKSDIKKQEDFITIWFKQDKNRDLSDEFAKLDAKKAELKRVEEQIKQQHTGKVPMAGIDALHEKHRKAVDNLEFTRDRIVDLVPTLQTLQDQITRDKMTLEDKKADARALEKQIAWLSREPRVVSVRLQAASSPRFTASHQKSDETLKAFQQTLDEIDKTIPDIRSQLDDVDKLLSGGAAQMREDARKTYIRKVKEANEAGKAVADLIMENRWWRFGSEFAGNTAQVLLAFKDGGPAGAFLEGLSIANEMYQKETDGLLPVAFKSFDERQLRNRTTGAPEAGKPAAGTQNRIRDMMLKEYVMAHLVQQRKTFEAHQSHQDLQKTASALRDKQATTHRKVTQAAGEYDQSRTKAARTASRLDSTMDDVAKGRRTYEDYLDSKNKYRSAVAQERDSLRKLVQAKNEYDTRTRFLKDAEDKMKRSQAKVQKVMSSTSWDFGKTFAKGVAVNLAIDKFKDSMHQRFDKQEQAAWMNLFEKEFALRVATLAYQDASNFYCHCYDHRDQLRQHLESLQVLREQTEMEREAYLGKNYANLHVTLNKTFFDNDRPLELDVQVVGPESKTTAHLAASENANAKSPKTLQWQSAASGPGATENSLPPSDKQVRHFVIPAQNLSSLQAQGPLILTIRHH